MEMTFILAAALIVALGVIVGLFFAARRGREDTDARQTAEMAEKFTTLEARLRQMDESHITAQSQLTRTLEERFEAVSKRLGDGISQHTEKTGKTMSEVQERLAVIDAAQKNLTQLSEQVVGLQDILSNKQARGAFGEIQLNDLVSSILPPSAYDFQATLSNAKRADCLLRLPNPPGAMVIDAKFPLESYRALQDAKDDAGKKQAGRDFARDVNKHVRDIADKYIVAGETADSALMFLPSEAVYAELHANFANVVEDSFRRKVWIVSPTTLMATLNTVRAVLKDARMQEQAGLIQVEVQKLLVDVGRLGDRVGNLKTHFRQASEDIDKIEISSEKITKRGDDIVDAQLGGDGEPAEELAPPATVTRLKPVGE